MEGNWFCILVFFSTLSSIITATSAIDTMNILQSIRYNETVVSAGGTFELGFFNPDNSRERFLGIWYKKLVSSSKTVVWVANRETPIVDSDSSSVLKFTNPGNLVLLNGDNTAIWTSNVTGPVVNPVAQLLESGNLVVINNDDPDNFLWQSFDYPCDTFLPGMKLGRNTITGHDWYLQSWKSSNDPSPGEFTIRVDPLGFPQLVILKNSAKQFRSGPWNGILFNGMHDSSPKPIYKFSFSFNQKEIYYTYELINGAVAMRMVLNQNGVMQGLTWNDPTKNWNVELTSQMDDCDKYAHCGKYGNCNIYNQTQCGCLDRFVPKYPNDWVISDWTNGCVRRTPLNCAGGDGFIKYPGIKLPDTRSSWFNVTMTLEECRMRCLKNCSCMAYASLDISKGGSGCLLWSDDLFDIRTLTENGQDIYIRMASSEVGQVVSSGRKRDKPRVIILVLSFGTVLICLILALALYLWKKKKKPIREGIELYNPESNSESQKGDLELPLFDLATVDKATNNFSINNKIGEGGFGPVYKGVLEGGQEIAVKRLSQDSRQGLDEFKNEVKCIAKLQHRNLVKLLGCCIEEKMLIYEYLPNKSLDFFIFDQTSSMLLDWSKRFNIINGIARGLLYLHQDSRLRIIHRDLKASNVLLDYEMNAKISDFGMARSFGGNETGANTTRVVGTYGYMSPEYAIDGLFSVKSDVFSFGVLVLEIVSGKKNRGFEHPDHDLNLIGHAWTLYGEGRSMELIDAPLIESCDLSEVLRSIHVGLLCVQKFPKDRPTMSSVVLMLGSQSALPQPKEPGFFIERNRLGKNENLSANDMTITLLAAR